MSKVLGRPNVSTDLDWITISKGIGIFLVVFGHVERGLLKASIGLEYESYLRAIDDFIYLFHMPLFFFLSGIFFLKSYEKYGLKFLLVNKVDTLLYPFLLWSMLQGSIEVVLSNYTNGDVGFSDVLISLIHPRAQFWFLFALFSFFIFTSVVYSFSGGRGLLLCIFSSLVFYFYLPDYNYLSGYFGGFYVFFVFGIYFRNEIINLMNTLDKIDCFYLSIVLLSLMFICTHYFGDTYKNYSIYRFMFAIAGCLIVIFLSRILVESRVLSALGRYSMIIYLSHIIVGSGMRVILSKIFGVEDIYIHLVAGTVSGLLGPYIFAKVLQKFSFEYFERGFFTKLSLR